METKGLFKSVTALSSLASIAYGLLAWYQALPPELVSDTKGYLVMVVSSAIALFGRWRAVTQIKGLF